MKEWILKIYGLLEMMTDIGGAGGLILKIASAVISYHLVWKFNKSSFDRVSELLDTKEDPALT